MRMANLINSMTNDKLSELKGNSVPLKELGKLTKLLNEIKLIEGFQSIKVTGAREIVVDQKPAQLLEARTLENKGFSLIVDNKNLALESIKQAGIQVDSQQKTIKLSYVEPQRAANLDQDKNPINPINNNNLNTKINKHYAPFTRENNNQTLDSKQTQTSNRLELPVRLASKIEHLTVLAKTPIQTETRSEQSKETQITKPASNANAQINNINQEKISYSTAPKQHTTLISDQIMREGTKANYQTIVDNSRINPQVATPSITPVENETSNNLNPPLLQQNLKQTSSRNPNTPIQTSQQISTNIQAPQQFEVKPSSNNQVDSQTDNKQVPLQTSQRMNTNTQAPQQALTQTNTSSSTLDYGNKHSMHSQQVAITPPLSNGRILDSSQQVNETKISTSSYKVSNGTEEFYIKVSHPLTSGEKLQVFRDVDGNMQLLPRQTETTSNILNNEFAKSLPQQLSKEELVDTFKRLTLANQDTRLEPNTLKQLSQLINSIPNQQDLNTPQAIKQAMLNSGLFFESKLFQNLPNLNQDLKANLLNIQKAVIFQTANHDQVDIKTDLLNQDAGKSISQAIERITSSQIRNLLESTKIDGINLPLVLEIPIQDKEQTSILQLQIDQDKSDQAKPNKKRKWLAKLLFDFPETGKFEARVNVEENKVSVIFVAEKPNTELDIRKNRNKLTHQLEEKGLEVIKLDSFCRPMEESTNRTKKHNLIDVRT